MGRPLIFATPELMQEAIDAYFATRDKDNRPTITGLALALGLSGRDALINYQERDEFHDTVKKAKEKVQEFVENRLYDPNATGCIFNLKNNFGWKDKSELEQYGKDGVPLVPQKITIELVKPGNANSAT